MDLKQRLVIALDDTQPGSSGWVTSLVSLLILVSAAIFVVETYPLPPALEDLFHVIDWVILGLFTLEYGLRVWSADCWWRYVISPYGWIDLLAILPFLLGFLDMRFVRLLRWLRVLRLARLLGDRSWLGRVATPERLVVIRIVATLFTLIFIYAGIIFQIEQHFHPGTFTSYLDAAYFAVVTMTTVGFGDITPVSEAGRWFTVLMILTGITLIPSQLSALIRSVVKVSQTKSIPCNQCHWGQHDADAQFCKRCGTALPLTTEQLAEAEAVTLTNLPQASVPFMRANLED